MKEKKTEIESQKKAKIAEAKCEDRDCPTHGNLKTRGREFEGKVTRKFHKRIAIEFEKTIYVRKYERYAKTKTKIHARLPIHSDDDSEQSCLADPASLNQ